MQSMMNSLTCPVHIASMFWSYCAARSCTGWIYWSGLRSLRPTSSPVVLYVEACHCLIIVACYLVHLPFNHWRPSFSSCRLILIYGTLCCRMSHSCCCCLFLRNAWTLIFSVIATPTSVVPMQWRHHSHAFFTFSLGSSWVIYAATDHVG